jgi:hypothetical protein
MQPKDLSTKEVYGLFVSFVWSSRQDLPNHGTSYYVLDIIEKPLMSTGCTQVVWFHNASLYGGEVEKLLNIEKCFSIENPFKSKLRIIVEFEHALGIIGKLSMSGLIEVI